MYDGVGKVYYMYLRVYVREIINGSVCVWSWFEKSYRGVGKEEKWTVRPMTRPVCGHDASYKHMQCANVALTISCVCECRLSIINIFLVSAQCGWEAWLSCAWLFLAARAIFDR